MPPQIVLIGTTLILLTSFSYIRDTLFGHTKPNRITWLLWAVIPVISLGISYQAGATIWEILPIIAAGAGPVLIFAASLLNKQAYWKLTTFDFVCGVLSVIAMIIWLLADSPVIATVFVILADAAASLPTLHKTWLEPRSESRAIYVASTIDKGLGLAILSSWSFVHSGFIIWLLICSLIIIALTYRQVRPQVDKIA